MAAARRRKNVVSTSKLNASGLKLDGIEPKIARSLTLYEKQSRQLAYKELPENIHLEKKKWDLSHWTLVISDACLHRLKDKSNIHRLEKLDLSGGDKITDSGLKVLIDKVPNLTSISLENAFQITEKSLARLVKSCNQLKELNLSGCLGISGTGFAILGQHACGLVHLQTSGCRHITPWAFMKIFEGCRQLENLDISYCSMITDQEVKVLADCCTALKHLNIKECRQISDVGILSLSKGSSDLMTIVLTRHDLVSRITDVSLLAIAEGCPMLKVIDLTGCEMITDVGISWLAKGCKYVERVNFTNCSKITNVGMRYLSEECKVLQTIILKNVKKVSDVGLRFLANGCPEIEYVNASGMCLLTDGVQRDFGHEGLQALATADCCKSMKKINLHGCFRVSDISLKYLSSMENLESLVLSGCKSILFEAISILFKSCLRLSHLSLATCGECITDAMIESIGSNVLHLKTLDLTDCIKVGRRGLKSLSRCSELMSLNLSGCKRVSNEAILALGEGDFRPGIRELYLNRCVRLDDTVLTWIVDCFKDRSLCSGNVTLVTLALKGTKITQRALKAIQSCFQYSALKGNATYFGFLALNRSDDRRIINDHAKMTDSIALIQAAMRARRCRLIVGKARDQHKKTQMATLISAAWRAWLARSLARRRRTERWCRRMAAIKLQCFSRIVLARIVTDKLRYKRWRSLAPIMATKIQKHFRGHRGRRRASLERNFQMKKLHQQQQSCIKIQRTIRMNIAISTLRKLKEEALVLRNKQLRSCIMIQKRWRSEIARQKVNELRLDLFKLRRKQHKASKSIARMVRSHNFRSCIQKRIEHTRWLHTIATSIQRWFRERLTEAKIRAEEELLLAKLRNDAVVCIQSYGRMWMAKIVLSKLQIAQDDLRKLQAQKGLVITSWSKMQLARMKATQLRKERDERLKQEYRVQLLAAIQIEAFWRGCKGRKIARTELEKKKSRWKQMWSEKDNAYFYYNQITGQSRWRKPQDLLDLEPRPICGNCCFYDAQVECSNCGEYYCTSCWDAVHYGGKRKHHSFRTLYDFYQRRIDYGDGEFPSLWPSEVEQDNQGWYKR